MLSFSQRFTLPSLIKSWVEPTQCILSRTYAARKGTRERKNKKKVKVVVEKVGFIPHNLRDREKLLAKRQSLKFDDSLRRTPTDEIYCAKYYKWKVYPFVEAIQCHRETHHPEMYNQPNSSVEVVVELNMQGEKKTRFVENFNRICGIDHIFPHGEERTVIAFVKDSDIQKKALEAGAQLSGGIEVIKDIQNGKLSLLDYQFVIAHPDILHELSSLRGLLKKKFPNAKAGTLEVDLETGVKRFLHGIDYTAVKDEYEKDFGTIKTCIGTLDMDSRHLEENFAALIKDIMLMKPKRAGDFIRRCLIKSPPSGEVFKVDHNLYLDKSTKTIEEKDEKEDDEIDQRAVLQ